MFVHSRHFRIWKFVSLLTEAFRWLQSHRFLLAIRDMLTTELVSLHVCVVLIVNDERLGLAGQQGISSYWIPCLCGSMSPTLLEKCFGITIGLAYLLQLSVMTVLKCCCENFCVYIDHKEHFYFISTCQEEFWTGLCMYCVVKLFEENSLCWCTILCSRFRRWHTTCCESRL